MGYWSQIYPPDLSDSGLAQTDIAEQGNSAASPVTAGQRGPATSAPTVSLLVILGILVAVRLLLKRGVQPGQ